MLFSPSIIGFESWSSCERNHIRYPALCGTHRSCRLYRGPKLVPPVFGGSTTLYKSYCTHLSTLSNSFLSCLACTAKKCSLSWTWLLRALISMEFVCCLRKEEKQLSPTSSSSRSANAVAYFFSAASFSFLLAILSNSSCRLLARNESCITPMILLGATITEARCPGETHPLSLLVLESLLLSPEPGNLPLFLDPLSLHFSLTLFLLTLFRYRDNINTYPTFEVWH